MDVHEPVDAQGRDPTSDLGVGRGPVTHSPNRPFNARPNARLMVRSASRFAMS